MTALGCPRCLTPITADATVCGRCGTTLGQPLPAPFFAGAAQWKRGPNDELVFEASAAPLPPPRELLVDEIPSDFDPSEVLGDKTVVTTMPVPPSGNGPDTGAEAESDDSSVEADSVTSQAGLLVLAEPWRRAASLAIDVLPFAGALMLTFLALEGRLERGGAPLVPGSFHDAGKMFWTLGSWIWLVLAVAIVVPVAYHALSLVYMGGSVGDLLLGIRWVTKQGERPKLVRALLRSVIAIFAWALALSGVLLVLLTRTRRTLYDVLTGCYPVRR